MSVLGQALDWQQPWLAPWRAEAATVDAMLAAGASVAELLNALHRQSASGAVSLPWMPDFVSQAALPTDQAYEQFIFDTRQVPTRDNLHDLFNGLCWLRFPETKRCLNALQAAQIARSGVQPLRGAPSVSGPRVFFLSQDNQLHALDGATGEVSWTVPGTVEPACILGTGAPAVSLDTVVAGFCSGELKALRGETGRTVWEDQLARTGRSTAMAALADIDGSPVIDRGRVFAVGHEWQCCGCI